MPLYYSVKKNINQAIKSTGSEAWCGCHISHTYHSGASLYFTFVAEQSEKLGIEQYLYIKKAAEDAFIDGGGTLSHHHAVGYEHIPWIEKEVSATAMGGIKSLKQGLDPKGIMNPGKIIASECFDWGLSAATNNDLKWLGDTSMMNNDTSVYDFYRDKNVLITGGTGFVGKVLLEKILRSLECNEIYIIIRDSRKRLKINTRNFLFQKFLKD